MLLNDCPSHDELIAFLAEQLDEGLAHRVEMHLGSCAACRSVLDARLAEDAPPPSSPPAPPARWTLDDAFWREFQQELASPAEPPAPGQADQQGDFLAALLVEPPAGADKGPGRTDTLPLRPAAPPGPPGRLGSYQVQAVVGRGGMGVVLRAFDETLHRVVAIKVLAPHLATDAAARQRFGREARAAAAVCDDHVVTIHAVHDQERLPYLVMQFIAGQSLQDKLDRGPLSVPEVLRIGAQIAKGLAAAHKQGLIHRDIKPANILLENGVERVKIVDFGLARAAAEAPLTRNGHVAGTPDYMSPEQASGQRVDPRSDLFSLGAVLYAMCTGRPPFRADSDLAVLHRLCQDAPQPIQEINPAIPPALCQVVERLLAKDPAGRLQTAVEAAEQLNGLLARAQADSDNRVEAAAPAPASARAPRRRLARLAGGVALVLLLAGGAAVYFRDGADPSPGVLIPTPSPPPRSGEGAPEVVTPPSTRFGQGTVGRGSEAGAAIPLLPLVDLPRDVVRGKWRLASGVLYSPNIPDGYAWLQLPCCPPAEYDLSLRAERVSGNTGLHLGLVVGGRQVQVVLDGWGGAISGLSRVAGKPANENASRVNGVLLQPGKRCRIDCCVRASRVTVAVEGTNRIDWQGDPTALSVPKSHRVPNPDCLYVSSINSSFAVTDLSVRLLSAPGWRFSDPGKASPARVAAEQLLWQGCRLRVVPRGGQAIPVERPGDLPGKDFHVAAVGFRVDADADRIVARLPERVEIHRLEVDHTAFSGAGIAPLSRLAGLEELSVVDTLLSDADLPKLAGLAGLKTLRLGWGQFSAAAREQFAGLLPGCQVSELSPDQTAARTCLALGWDIAIRDKDVVKQGRKQIAGLLEGKEFRVLDIRLPEKVTFAPQHFRCLRDLAELRDFRSWYNNINDDCIRPWRDLPRLEKVHLGTSRLTAAGLERLSGFSSIRELNLFLSSCDDAAVAHLAKLTQLEVLSLGQTSITDAAVEPLCKLKQLKTLGLMGTKITPAGAERLRQALPSCKVSYR